MLIYIKAGNTYTFFDYFWAIMKKIKILFFSTLLLFSIAQMLGNDIIRYFDELNYSMENNCPSQENKNLITSEPSIEEEPTLMCYSNPKETLLSLQENLSICESKLPIKLYYSIWLPPDRR